MDAPSVTGRHIIMGSKSQVPEMPEDVRAILAGEAGVKVIDLDAIPGGIRVPLTYGDEKVVEWAYETLKDSPKVVLDALRQLAGLSAALLAGSVAFMKDLPAIWKAILVVALFISLVLTAIGMMPVAGPKDPSDPEEVRKIRAKCIRWRERWAWAAAIFLLVAGAAATIGSVIMAFMMPPPPFIPPAAQ